MTSLGIDVGSVAVHLALLDGDGRVLWRRSRRQGGKVAATLTALLQALIDERGDEAVRVGLTASARPLVGPDWPAVTATSEVVAAVRRGCATTPWPWSRSAATCPAGWP